MVFDEFLARFVFIFRLSKLFQQEFKVFIERIKLRGRSTQSASQMRYSSQANERNDDTLGLQTCSKSAEDLPLHAGTLMCLSCMFSVPVCRSKVHFCFTYLGSERKLSTQLTSEHKEHNNTINTGSSSSPQPDTPSSNYPDFGCGGAQEPKIFPTLPSVGDSEEHHQKESCSHGYMSSELQHKGGQVFNNAGAVIDCWTQTNIPADPSRSAEQTDCCTLQSEAPGGRQGQKNVPYNSSYGICCHGSRLSLDDFKEFLQGRPGEKTFNLWMDIERLRSVQNRERKNR